MANFISDTVTKPSQAMLDAMMASEVGDDTFGEDPTVNILQEKCSALFGMEDAIFCPSGTMTNQIAIKTHTIPGDAVICSSLSHIHHYEGGGMAVNSGVTPYFVDQKKGMFTADQVEQVLTNFENVHTPHTSLISIENTTNKGGGAIWDLEEMKKISHLARKESLNIHLDGARLFNALVERSETPEDIGKLFDSISICFSKGLGAPVGSILIGSKDFIRRARRVRKVMGGMMRQSGYLAAAAIFALDNNINRLKDDHKKAKTIATSLESCSWVKDVTPPETNIIIFQLEEDKNSEEFIELLANHGHKIIAMDKRTLRITTHLDITDQDVEDLTGILHGL